MCIVRFGLDCLLRKVYLLLSKLCSQREEVSRTQPFLFPAALSQSGLLQGHEGKAVTVIKRWWTCAGCNHLFSTLGVKYPTKRCPNPRYREGLLAVLSTHTHDQIHQDCVL